VMKASEVDAAFARARASFPVHETPAYAVVFRISQGRAAACEAHDNADEVWFVRRGNARLSLGSAQYEAGAGDVVHVPRRAACRIDSGGGRFEYVAVRVFPETAPPRPTFGGLLAARRMPDVLKKSAIDSTFAASETNQPLHAAANFTVNYVIYKGRSGPWEAHRGCVDIYFVYTGAAAAELGGEISNPQEEAPGEIRGAGVTGARRHSIGPGDIVLIPRNTAHHMTPSSQKLGYLLVKVWAE
ncbi:MAG: cupin domain-containing protein, partial [Candidatus Solibacter usitatus]|nr:cupin domain-containing protein [Candidatus Solibacter usitatus]